MAEKNSSPGQILIIVLLFFLVVLVIAGALLGLVFQNVRGTRLGLTGEQAMQLAEAGVDRAIWQLNETTGAYTGETGTVLGAGVFDVAVTTLSSSLKEITATGYVPSKVAPQSTRQVKVQVTISTSSVSFNYGVQVGEGGLEMENNSRVNGSVYSDGPIEGGNGARITGTAYSAGAAGRITEDLQIDGNAYAHQIDDDVNIGGNAYGYILDDVTVGGNAFFNTIRNCTIGGNAYFTTKTFCTIGGSQNTPYAGEPDPPSLPLPISDQQIADWKDSAAAGGTISGSYTLSNGAQGTLGPKKITGSLTLSNNARLTLTGPLWVQGAIQISNGAILALDPSYGDTSEVVVTDGTVDVSNVAVFERAGPDSYILMLTTNSGSSAYTISNNADALIAYASAGTVRVSNNALVREVTGYRLELSNNAVITYESGLADLTFTGGPGASWTVVRGTLRRTD